MNYGEEFIKLYNKEFLTFRKEISERIKTNYGSAVDDGDLIKDLSNYLYNKSQKIVEKDNKGEVSSSLSGLCLGLMSKKYKFDRIKNIININFYNLFKEKQKYSNYADFNEFLQLFSKFYVYENYHTFLKNKREEFIKLLNKENIDSFFIIRKNQDGLNELDAYFGNTKRQLKNQQIDSISNKIELDDTEKSILLNILFFHFMKDDMKNVPLTEKYRLLILCSSVLNEEDFFNVKSGYKPFDYFKLGVSKSMKFKGDKRIKIDNIINKLNTLTGLKESIKSIKRLRNDKDFYF